MIEVKQDLAGTVTEEEKGRIIAEQQSRQKELEEKLTKEREIREIQVKLDEERKHQERRKKELEEEEVHPHEHSESTTEDDSKPSTNGDHKGDPVRIVYGVQLFTTA